MCLEKENEIYTINFTEQFFMNLNLNENELNLRDSYKNPLINIDFTPNDDPFEVLNFIYKNFLYWKVSNETMMRFADIPQGKKKIKNH